MYPMSLTTIRWQIFRDFAKPCENWGQLITG